jgi:hypothetical protein
MMGDVAMNKKSNIIICFVLILFLQIMLTIAGERSEKLQLFDMLKNRGIQVQEVISKDYQKRIWFVSGSSWKLRISPFVSKFPGRLANSDEEVLQSLVENEFHDSWLPRATWRDHWGDKDYYMCIMDDQEVIYIDVFHP